MKFDVDLEAGTVKGEFSLPEFLSFLSKLEGISAEPTGSVASPAAQSTKVRHVRSFTSHDEVYLTVIWFNAEGTKYGSCSCKDCICRKRWCKHLLSVDTNPWPIGLVPDFA